MDEKQLVIILNDIHIGTPSPTVWYNKEIHEKYLISILDNIIENADMIKEVILLGDIFELWSYSPNELPPTLEDIIYHNRKVLGPEGKFCEILSRLKGNITYIPGEHDIYVTEEDIQNIKSLDGYTMHYHAGAYIPEYDNGILFTHGNEYTLLNAPYFTSKLGSLPIGYFISRAISYQLKNMFHDNPKLHVSQLNNYGVSCLNNFLKKIMPFLNSSLNSKDFVCKLTDAIAYMTGIPKDLKIQINEFTSVSLNEVKYMYGDLLQIFYNTMKKMGMHEFVIGEHAFTSMNTFNQPWFLESSVFGNFIDTVVTGHTHFPMRTYGKNNIKYVNTGSMCPAVSNVETSPMTYGIYSLTDRFVKLSKVIVRPGTTI